MAFINWTEEFATGIDSIDEQHRHLVDLVNKFEEASRRGKGSRVMSEILKDLVGYTQEHFAHEEKIMEKCDFPGSKQHMARHRQLLQKVERFQFEFETEGRRSLPMCAIFCATGCARTSFMKTWPTPPT